MPASLPGSTLAQNKANPSLGQAVIFCALSGPKGSPLDVRRIDSWDAATKMPQYVNDAANQTPSTGGMSTGIGFGCNAGGPKMNVFNGAKDAPDSIRLRGFTDDKGDGVGVANSTGIYIGGGRSTASAAKLGIPFAPEPYTAGFVPGNAGNGGSRDAGAGPAFTCFVGKFVTATGAVANGAAVETGYVNRSGVALVATESVFGSASAAQAAPA